MGYEMKELSGSLFKNTKREKDTQPNATGSALIDGVEYWVSAWTKADKNGQPWQSLAFKRKEAGQAPEPSKPTKLAKPVGDLDDDIPF